jgi:hypothetical protein
MVNGFLKFHKHVERGNLPKIEDGIAMENFIVEAEIIESDDEIGAQKLIDEVVYLLLSINFVIPATGAVSDPDAHAHIANVVPATDFIGGFLSFEVKIDNVLHRGERLACRGEIEGGGGGFGNAKAWKTEGKEEKYLVESVELQGKLPKSVRNGAKNFLLARLGEDGY